MKVSAGKKITDTHTSTFGYEMVVVIITCPYISAKARSHDELRDLLQLKSTYLFPLSDYMACMHFHFSRCCFGKKNMCVWGKAWISTFTNRPKWEIIWEYRWKGKTNERDDEIHCNRYYIAPVCRAIKIVQEREKERRSANYAFQFTDLWCGKAILLPLVFFFWAVPPSTSFITDLKEKRIF